MRYLTFILLFIGVNTISAQTIYEEFESYKLDERRQIKIQLPRNYKDNVDKSYPLFIVLDGDYLFEVTNSPAIMTIPTTSPKGKAISGTTRFPVHRLCKKPRTCSKNTAQKAPPEGGGGGDEIRQTQTSTSAGLDQSV